MIGFWDNLFPVKPKDLRKTAFGYGIFDNDDYQAMRFMSANDNLEEAATL